MFFRRAVFLSSWLVFSGVFLTDARAEVGAEVVVSNVRSAQRTGEDIVDIDYDLSGGVPPYTVTLRVSHDDGATFTVPVTSVSGAIGAGISAGSNKRIVWQAGADWNNQYSDKMRYEMTAVDSYTPSVTGDMVLIPGGNFTMGDQSNPLVGYSGELPVHSVYVSPYYMGKYEVTKELWDEVRAWGMQPSRGYTDLAAGNGIYASKGANHPVHSIPWYDAVKWCNARSEMENLTPCYTVSGVTYQTGQNDAVVCNFAANGYRLPTEAEWEKAARGGASGKNFPWGDAAISHERANFRNIGGETYQTGTTGPHPLWSNNNNGAEPYSSPVGSFAPDPVYGLYDMAGNMVEWCWDRYGVYTADSQTDPRGATSGSFRVRRGGGWGIGANGCRVAVRNGLLPSDPSDPYDDMGFRAARSLVP